MRITLEIWRNVEEPGVIELAGDGVRAQVTNLQGRSDHHPTLFAKLSELLDESGEAPAGRRQRGEGKRARRASELPEDSG